MSSLQIKLKDGSSRIQEDRISFFVAGPSVEYQIHDLQTISRLYERDDFSGIKVKSTDNNYDQEMIEFIPKESILSFCLYDSEKNLYNKNKFNGIVE